MVGLDAEDDGDVGGDGEVPKLEAGEFVDDDVGRLEFVEDFDGGATDIADEMDGFSEGFEERSD